MQKPTMPRACFSLEPKRKEKSSPDVQPHRHKRSASLERKAVGREAGKSRRSREAEKPYQWVGREWLTARACTLVLAEDRAVGHLAYCVCQSCVECTFVRKYVKHVPNRLGFRFHTCTNCYSSKTLLALQRGILLRELFIYKFVRNLNHKIASNSPSNYVFK
jgi:hypothetical protein